MKTVIFSDVHGCKEALDWIFDNVPADRYIFGGDAVDSGPTGGSVYCVNTLNSREDVTFIVGNHEFAHFIGMDIWPYDDVLDVILQEEFDNSFYSGKWKYSESVEGFLITHAGVSKQLRNNFDFDIRDVEGFSKEMNELFHNSLSKLYESYSYINDLPMFLLDNDSPLWYRPSPYTVCREIPQVVGHTPRNAFKEKVLESLETGPNPFYVVNSPYINKTCCPCWVEIEDGKAKFQIRSDVIFKTER